MKPRKIPYGFTLIEILVVLLIVSIMTGITVLGLPALTRTGDLDTESARVRVLLEMLLEEASVGVSEYGFGLTEDGYRFFAWDEQLRSWRRLEDKPFQPRQLPDDLRLSLEVEGEDFAGSLNAAGEAPPVWVMSSGEVTPFRLTIRAISGDRASRILVCDGYGSFQWQEDNET